MKPAKGADRFTREENELMKDFLESMKGGLRAMGIFEFTEDEDIKIQLNYDAWNYADNSFAVRPESFNPYMYSIMEKVEN